MRGIAGALARMGVDESLLIDFAAKHGDGRELGRSLLAQGKISEAQLAEATAHWRKLPFLDLSTRNLDPEIVQMVPAPLCRRYRVLPIALNGDHLTLAMVDPTDIFALDDVGTVTRLLISPVVVSAEGMDQALNRYLRSDDELSDLTQEIEDQAEITTAKDDLEDVDSSAPIVRFVNLLIAQAIQPRPSTTS